MTVGRVVRVTVNSKCETNLRTAVLHVSTGIRLTSPHRKLHITGDGDRRDVPQFFDELKSVNVPSVPGFFLGRQGYETAVRGKSGFVYMVERSWMEAFDSPEFWNPKVRGAEAPFRLLFELVEAFMRWAVTSCPTSKI